MKGGEFFFQLFDFERSEPLEPHFENRVRLLFRKLERLREFLRRLRFVFRRLDDPDHFVHVRERENKPLDDMRAFFRFREFVTRAADDDFLLVRKIARENFAQVEHFGFSAVFHERKQDDPVGNLQIGVLVKGVQNDLRVRVFLAFDDDPQALSAGLFADIRNAFEPLVPYHVRDRLDELRFIDLIGDLRDHDTGTHVSARAVLLDLAFRADHEVALSRTVRLADPASAHDNATRGEVGRGDVIHQFFHGNFGVVDHRDRPVDDLRKVVRGDIGRHADGNPVRPVYEQIGKARGEDGGLHFVAVEVGEEVHRLFIEIAQHFRRQLRKARFGITHRRGGIAVHRTEVPVSVHEREVDREILREADERVVHGSVAVRVEFTEHVADDTGALAVRLVVVQPHLVHCVHDSAVYGF